MRNFASFCDAKQFFDENNGVKKIIAQIGKSIYECTNNTTTECAVYLFVPLCRYRE